MSSTTITTITREEEYDKDFITICEIETKYNAEIEKLTVVWEKQKKVIQEKLKTLEENILDNIEYGLLESMYIQLENQWKAEVKEKRESIVKSQKAFDEKYKSLLQE